MASAAIKIPQEQWETHKETILHLYHVERLHLDSGDRNVVQVMQDEHQFFAT